VLYGEAVKQQIPGSEDRQMDLTVPQGPWLNPSIAEGEYDARIVEIKQGRYGPQHDLYLQVVLWLCHTGQYLVSNFYFPRGKPDGRTIQRLSRLCQIVGRVPQDALDAPYQFKGAELKVRVRKFRNDDHEYCCRRRLESAVNRPV
jgi:hypothetical protein